MADTVAQTGIEVVAEDKTAPAFKSASKGAERLAKKFASIKVPLASVGNGLKALPDAAGKASAAMLLLNGSASQFGAGAADTVNKLGPLVAIVAIGGPLGIGLAAIAAAALAAAAIFNVFSERTKSLTAEQEALNKVWARGKERLDDLQSQVDSANEAFLSSGRDALEMQQEQIQNQVTLAEIGLAGLEQELARAQKADIMSRGKSAADIKQANLNFELSRKLFNDQKAKLDKLVELEEITGARMIQAREKREQEAADRAKQLRTSTIKTNAAKAQAAVVALATWRESFAARTDSAINARLSKIAADNKAREIKLSNDVIKTRKENNEAFWSWKTEREKKAAEKAARNSLAAALATTESVVTAWADAREQIREADTRAEKEAIERAFQVQQKQIAMSAALADIERNSQEMIAKAKTEAEREEIRQKTELANIITKEMFAVHDLLQAKDDESRRKAISNMIDIAQAAIVAKAASGAASAFEGAVGQFGPIFGPVIGAAAAIAVGAAIMAFRSQINLAQGGRAVGGVPGKDSIPAMLRPDEEVFTPEQIADGRGPSGGGGIALTVNMPTVLPNSTDYKRAVREIGKGLSDLAGRGMAMA